MEIDDLLPRSDEDKFCRLPFAERLEKLRPIIIELYTGNYGPGGKRMMMRQVVEFMKNKYSFHMAQNQLEYALRKWNVRRRILNREKDDVTAVLGKRTRAGTSTSDVTLQEGKPVDKKQLKRHLQDKIRRYVAEPMVPGVLSSWNLPYEVLKNSIIRQLDMPSPFDDIPTTPNYITVNSPNDTTGTSPPAVTSPSMQLIRQKFRQDQSNSFFQGQLMELFVKCGKENFIALTNYMHDFWVHNFVTAKYWGRGPLLWTKGMITAETLDSLEISFSESAIPGILFEFLSDSASDEVTTMLMPGQLCGWYLHGGFQTPDTDEFLDTPWPLAELNGRSFPQFMAESITKSTFTSLPPDDLPISSSLIAESLRIQPGSLHLESLRFAIMAGNHKLVTSLLIEGIKEPRFIESLKELYLYHFAVSYLDGANYCCLVFRTLDIYIGDHYSIVQNYEDAAGHTLLDSLIISIISSHTRVSPREVSSSFIDTDMYPGEEKDICGRWDADSPAVRQLFRQGKHRIPLNWKHPFCHSSLQAVYHIILWIFPPGDYVPYINRLSGLFIRHCVACGAKLSLGTFHLIVVLAFHLADSGIPGETLFGAVAMLVCLLRLGADPSLKTEASFDEILGSTHVNDCHHENLDAYGFLQTVAPATVHRWSPECQIGWHCLRGVLQLAKYGEIRRSNTEVGEQPGPSDQFDTTNVDNDTNHNSDDSDGSGESSENDDSDKSDNDDDVSTTSTLSCWLDEYHDTDCFFPCGNPQLGLIWATIQAEMLTYRKLIDSDPYISDNFSMCALKTWLEGESVELEMPLAEGDILRAHTICGWFDKKSFPLHTEKDVAKQHTMYHELVCTETEKSNSV